jgi:hypothetical protein
VKNRADEIVGASKLPVTSPSKNRRPKFWRTANDEAVRQNRLKDEF